VLAQPSRRLNLAWWLDSHHAKLARRKTPLVASRVICGETLLGTEASLEDQPASNPVPTKADAQAPDPAQRMAHPRSAHLTARPSVAPARHGKARSGVQHETCTIRVHLGAVICAGVLAEESSYRTPQDRTTQLLRRAAWPIGPLRARPGKQHHLASCARKEPLPNPTIMTVAACVAGMPFPPPHGRNVQVKQLAH